MKRIIFIAGVIITATSLFWSCNSQKEETQFDSYLIDQMAVEVLPSENREISFTNKESAFYFTQSHITNHREFAWFSGWNIAKRRIFQDYGIEVDGKAVERNTAKVIVYPHKMIRRYIHVEEVFSMFDYEDVLMVELNEVKGKEVSFFISGDKVKVGEEKDGVLFYNNEEHKDFVLAVAPINVVKTQVVADKIIAPVNAGGFLVIKADNIDAALEKVDEARAQKDSWAVARKDRMEGLINEYTSIQSNDPKFDEAMRWITETMDQLVTRQHGDGIYAGVPWFNEYWGRDSFISMPGATLVTGHFDVARQILLSFAEYQDTDPQSRFYGRVPNIVNPENIDYHTTDGTPRFINQMQEYIKYSGDTTLISEVFPYVERSIEGSLKNWTDKKGYLLHADNETWMDARRDYDKMPYSPRGTRANDIQALWYNQLLTGVYFAEYMGESEKAEKWQEIADKVRTNFINDFVDNQHDFMADRLDENDQADYKLRPNQLYAMDFMTDTKRKMEFTRKVWEELVYPWGVASLNRQDPFFHPYHNQWENYHKDQAYHSGTIWQWNNGMAMQRMIEAGQEEQAFRLLENMNEMALTIGCVGGLTENSDAYTRKEGDKWPTLSGTYLQAWSNGEHLRAWYQYFLGIRPDAISNRLVLAPRLPQKFEQMETQVKVMGGTLKASFKKDGKNKVWKYTVEGCSPTLAIDLPLLSHFETPVKSGETLTVSFNDSEATFTLLTSKGGEELLGKTVTSKEKQMNQKMSASIFEGVDFCKPDFSIDFPVLKTKYTRGNGM